VSLASRAVSHGRGDLGGQDRFHLTPSGPSPPSRRVRFTSRFTKQVNDLQFPAPSRPPCCHAAPCLGPLSDCLAARSGRAASPLFVPDAGCRIMALIAAAGPARGHRPRHCPAQAPSPDPTAAGPDGTRLKFRVSLATLEGSKMTLAMLPPASVAVLRVTVLKFSVTMPRYSRCRPRCRRTRR
jgi:hypothetical protein